MLKIYGAMLCPDCVKCCEALKAANVEFEFFDFADKLSNLKEFLAIRDKSDLFDSVREVGSIGIPCIVDEEGCISLDWSGYVDQAKA